MQYSVCDLSSEKGMLFDVFYDGTASARMAFDLIVLEMGNTSRIPAALKNGSDETRDYHEPDDFIGKMR